MKNSGFIARFSILTALAMLCVNTMAGDINRFSSLCNKNEIVIFGCKAKNKIVSLCLDKSNSLTPTLQYRFGVQGKVELTYPQYVSESLQDFYLSAQIGSDRGEARIKFSNGDFEYYLFDISDSGDVYSGVSVRKGSKEVARLECTDANASIKTDAYSFIQREEFDFNMNISRK